MAAKHVERRDQVAGESLGACEDPVWCEEERVVEEFVMEQPVPPYLFAFVVGELGFREVGPRTRVYAEAVPGVLDAASREFAGMEEMIRDVDADDDHILVIDSAPDIPRKRLRKAAAVFRSPYTSNFGSSEKVKQ
ncbi:Leukotriene A-4 hydrolase-like protein [Forsythia ovata]|uniref:Leukotriene A-4 hydrolase-like protein n=1 Tax=Forsythia ovata TaxID=205694 RepID=A0ABD1VL68_9LAMI